MSNGEEEQRRRRKIELDAEVAATAMRGIAMLQRGDMSPAQRDAMIELDERYLEEAEAIAPGVRG